MFVLYFLFRSVLCQNIPKTSWLEYHFHRKLEKLLPSCSRRSKTQHLLLTHHQMKQTAWRNLSLWVWVYDCWCSHVIKIWSWFAYHSWFLFLFLFLQDDSASLSHNSWSSSSCTDDDNEEDSSSGDERGVKRTFSQVGFDSHGNWVETLPFFDLCWAVLNDVIFFFFSDEQRVQFGMWCWWRRRWEWGW